MRGPKPAVAAVVLALRAFAQDARLPEVELQAAIRTETVTGDLKAAIAQYEAIVARHNAVDRALAAEALVRMAGCYQKLGDAQARRIYERVLREYAEQPAAAQARERLGVSEGVGRRASMQYRRLWAGEDADATGSVSSDGRSMSFTDWATGDLALRDLRSGSSRRLTNTGGWTSDVWVENSAISPDGRSVAYTWYSLAGGVELRVVGTAASPASEPRTLLARPGTAWLTPHAWSPDGRSLAVSILEAQRNEIALVSVADGALRTLREVDPRGVTGIAFSPDGNLVAYDAGIGPVNGENSDVFVRPVAGGAEVAVAGHPGRDLVMGWSPEGRCLLFSSDRGGTNALWGQAMIAGQPSGAPRLLKADIGDRSLGTSASGDLYVSVFINGRNVYLGELDLAAARLVGQPLPASERHVGVNQWPDWSPDGRFLSYVSGRTMAGRRQLLSIRSVETGETRELALALTQFFAPRWAPDGRSLAVQGIDLQGGKGIFRVDVARGEVTPLVQGTAERNPVWPEWSREGSKLYYLCFERTSAGAAEALVERDVASGTERELLRAPSLGIPHLSPDGTQIAFTKRRSDTRESAVLVLPVGGGEPREVLRVSHPALLWAGVSWTPDGRLIVTKAWPDSDRRELLLVAPTGGEPRPLSVPTYSSGGIRFHPDGRRIAFVAGTSSVEVWVLEGLDTAPAVRR